MNPTDAERARYHLNRRRGGTRPKAEPQTDTLFPKLKPQERRLVPLGRMAAPENLFPDLPECRRNLVPVHGWPDYGATT
jgi:hypothetical protein